MMKWLKGLFVKKVPAPPKPESRYADVWKRFDAGVKVGDEFVFVGKTFGVNGKHPPRLVFAHTNEWHDCSPCCEVCFGGKDGLHRHVFFADFLDAIIRLVAEHKARKVSGDLTLKINKEWFAGLVGSADWIPDE